MNVRKTLVCSNDECVWEKPMNEAKSFTPTVDPDLIVCPLCGGTDFYVRYETKVKVKEGTKGWFNVKLNDLYDVASFSRDTILWVTENSEYWVETVGKVEGFPDGAIILLNKKDISEKLD